jgi:dihydrofolate reductase
MGRLIYTLNVSLDGYVETSDHRLDWASIDEELHAWFNDLTRTQDASLYGRRMYQLMNGYWPTADAQPDATDTEREFARIWRALPKFVFSRTLGHVEGNARLVAGDVRERLAEIRAEHPGGIDVSGATLAAEFLRAGLVDAIQAVVHPVVLGGGAPVLPQLEQPIRLRLESTRTFASGVVALTYRVDRD